MKITLKDIRSFNELLIKKGFTKNSFSKRTKLSQPTVQQISSGKRRPSPTSAKIIAEVLEVSFDDLFKID